jgi:predicted DNA-binding transcriptional regulator AlpA
MEDHGGSIMPDPMAGMPPRYLRTPEAARFLGLSGRTLEKHRTYGTGPRYRKIGGRVVYALDDLQSWVSTGAKQSTSDPGIGTVFPAKRIVPAASAHGTAAQRRS